MLWTLKQNLSKLIDFYLFHPETWEKTKSYHRRGEEDAIFEALHSAFISSDEEGDVLRTRPLEWRSEEVSFFFSKFGLSL